MEPPEVGAVKSYSEIDSMEAGGFQPLIIDAWI